MGKKKNRKDVSKDSDTLIAKVGMLNCKGLNQITVRQEIKDWMSRRSVDILTLAETQCKEQTVESGSDYSIYLASEAKEHKTTHKGKGKGKRKATHTHEHAGVGFVISSRLLKHMVRIEQISFLA